MSASGGEVSLQMERSAFGRLVDVELGLAVNDSRFSRNGRGCLVLENLVF